MKKTKMFRLWVAIAAIIAVFFAHSYVNAASYPYLTLVSSQSSLVFEKGKKVDIKFRAYTGGHSSCKYFIEIRKDSINGSKVAETQGEYSITTDCTIGWNTAEYNPGKYVLKVSCQYYEDYYWHSPYDGEQVYDITLKGEYASGECGASLTWRLTDDHVLTISGSGNMKSYSYGGAPWNDMTLSGVYAVEDLIEKVVINEGVTSIGNNAFYDCDSLTEIKLPSTLKSIGEGAFEHSALERITIPNSVTSINKYTFSYCSNLVSVELSSGLKAIPSWAFEYCSSLESIVFPEGITGIGNDAFRGCYSLETITLPKTIKKIDNSAFQNCSSISKVIYNGTKEMWNAIDISTYNNGTLLSAELKCLGNNSSANSGSKDKWVNTSNGWMYQTSSGEYVRNNWKQISGSWYYFNDSGIMLTGWQKISGSWYYLNGGKMVTKWKKISGAWYFFKGDGTMASGWKKISGIWYYFDGGKMVTGTKVIGGKTYKFSSDGAWIS